MRRKRSTGRNPLDILSTGLTDNDNIRVGLRAAPRKVVVTERVSIARKFAAPRIDMGEYSPVSTHALEMQKLNAEL